MKPKLTLLAISGSLVLAAPQLLAQDTNTYGTNTLTQTWKYQKAFEKTGLGRTIPPATRLKEKLKLNRRAERRVEANRGRLCQHLPANTRKPTNPGLTRRGGDSAGARSEGHGTNSGSAPTVATGLGRLRP